MTVLVLALVAALGNVIGGIVAARGAHLGLRFISGSLAFGAGFMLAVAFLAMVPHAIELGGERAALYVLVGYLLVHLTQHTVTPHFHFGEETHDVSPATGVTALLGLLLHTFFDGVAIASGFAVSTEMGVLLFAAIFLHKLPEGVTISSIQLAGGSGPGSAIASAAMLGGATVLGVVSTSSVGFLVANGLALSAGVTIYVAASNLVPEFQHHRQGLLMPVMFFIGAGAFFASRELLTVVGLH